jgi:Domain of unknown function (DUF4328)
MTHHDQQHPATTYYPAYAAERPKDLTVLGVLAFAAAVLYTVFTLGAASVTGRAVRHLDTADTDYDWSLAVYAAGVFLGLVALVAGYVTGSMWLYRARRNAELMEPGRHYRRASGWAWGGWVCPVVNLWFPFQVVRDTHKAVAPLSISPLVGWWWALFLTQSFALRIARGIESNATDADASTAQGFEVLVSMLVVVALALWGLVIRRITKEQHARMYAAR